MNDLFSQMDQLCLKARREANLFTAYERDLYVHDRDFVEKDAQSGDTLLWIIKACGTWIALIDENREYAKAILSTVSQNERCYLIEVQRHDGKRAYGRIQPVEHSVVARHVDDVVPLTNRTPRRVHLGAHVNGLQLEGTVFQTELGRISAMPGAVAYVHFVGTQAHLVVPSLGLDRSLYRSRPEVEAAWKIEITSELGHAELHAVAAASITRVRRRLKDATPPKIAA